MHTTGRARGVFLRLRDTHKAARLKLLITHVTKQQTLHLTTAMPHARPCFQHQFAKPGWLHIAVKSICHVSTGLYAPHFNFRQAEECLKTKVYNLFATRYSQNTRDFKYGAKIARTSLSSNWFLVQHEPCEGHFSETLTTEHLSGRRKCHCQPVHRKQVHLFSFFSTTFAAATALSPCGSCGLLP